MEEKSENEVGWEEWQLEVSGTVEIRQGGEWRVEWSDEKEVE